MGDACNQARKIQGLIEARVREVYIEKAGKEARGALSKKEQTEAAHIWKCYCHNHLRSSCVRQAVKFEQRFPKALLEDVLKDLSPKERATTDVEGVVRAAAKVFLGNRSSLCGSQPAYEKQKGTSVDGRNVVNAHLLVMSGPFRAR